MYMDDIVDSVKEALYRADVFADMSEITSDSVYLDCTTFDGDTRFTLVIRDVQDIGNRSGK